MAHTAQVAAETVATDNNGDYSTVSPTVLAGDRYVDQDRGGSPPKPYVSAASGTTDSWSVTLTSSTGNTFTIDRASNGNLHVHLHRSRRKRPGRLSDSSGNWG